MRDFLTFCGLAALASGFAVEARAQQAASAPEAEIVVTGSVLRNQLATSAKRDSAVIGEFLFADEIGKLPDYNVPDAFRRVSGVTTIFDEDEGRYVALRGLNSDFTYVTIDDGAVAALDLGGDFGGGRRVMMETLPAVAVRSLEVLKSVQSNRDGQGSGGQINIVTRSAFDAEGLVALGSAFVGAYDSDAVPDSDNSASWRGDFLLSNRFGDAGQFGVLVSGAYRLKDRDQERVSPTAFNYLNSTLGAVTDVRAGDSSTPWARTIFGQAYHNEVRHMGGLAKLEYQPSAAFEASLQAQYYEQVDEEKRADLAFDGGTVTAVSGAGISVNDSSVFRRRQSWDINKYVGNAQFDLQWTPNDTSVLTTRITYSHSSWVEDAPRSDFRIAGIDYVQTPATRDFTAVNTVTQADLARFSDPTQYRLFDLTRRFDDEKEDVLEGAITYKTSFDAVLPGLEASAGLKARRTERSFDRDVYRWLPSASSDLRLNAFLTPGLEGTYVQPGMAHSSSFIEQSRVLARLQSNPTDFVLDTAFVGTQNRQQDFTVDETVSAAFAQLDYRGAAYRLSAGLRYEHTDVSALANLNTTRITSAGSVTSLEKTNRSGDYGVWLPSAAATFDLADETLLRFAYSRTIGRPAFLAIAGAVNITTNETTGLTTINEGNPGLKPRQVDSFDMSLEHYFDDNEGLVSIGVFYKSIEDDIFTRRTVLDNGATILNRPENAESATISGIEFSLVKNHFTTLPGLLSNFGGSINATLIDAEVKVDAATTYPFREEQPEFTLNAALFYQQGPFEGRLAWNRTGDFVTRINTANRTLNTSEGQFDQVDATLSYTLSPRLTLRAEARNLTDENRVLYFTEKEVNRDYNLFGRVFWLGASFSY